MSANVWMTYERLIDHETQIEYIRCEFRREKNKNHFLAIDQVYDYMLMFRLLGEQVNVTHFLVVLKRTSRDHHAISELSDHAKLAVKAFKGTRVAYVNGNFPEERVRFLNGALRGMGYDDMRAFNDEGEALAWLLEA